MNNDRGRQSVLRITTKDKRCKGVCRGWSRTIVMVTHEPDMAAYAQRCVHFLDGAIAVDELQEAIA
jgi:ABC-type lipoprotein export system ATPase subunit